MVRHLASNQEYRVRFPGAALDWTGGSNDPRLVRLCPGGTDATVRRGTTPLSFNREDTGLLPRV